jgi:hypothetical protein
MSYQEGKQGKFRRLTSKQAIGLAMEGRWQESIEINKGIIKNFPNDVDSHNRLGKAYMELGEYPLAKEAYEKALKLDQYNTIAKKNLERLAHLAEESPAPRKGSSEKAEPHLFIEEIGKAGVVNLYQTAPAEMLVKMLAGDKVVLKPQKSSLAVENVKGDYLGLVPARHAQRLVKLMEGGNKYTAAIISSNETSISVIIRETFQDPSQIGRVSFPGKRLEEVQPFVSDRVFRPGDEDEEMIDTPFAEEGLEVPAGAVEEVEEEKEWEQEA